LTAFPENAATARRTNVAGAFNAPVADNAPVANNSESPGRNGVTTNPVSAKMIANSNP
jgi:hypothetical protein